MARRSPWMLPIACLLAAGPSGIAAAEGLLGAPAADSSGTKAPMQAAPSVGGLASPAATGSPTALIKPFYEHFGLEIDPSQRGDFVDPAKTVLDKADALKKSGEGDCLDPNMALDNAAADKAEIDKSLKTLEAVRGDEAKVIVAFVVAGAPHRLEWKLKKVGGAWKIGDLLSVTGEWALSQYQCE